MNKNNELRTKEKCMYLRFNGGPERVILAVPHLKRDFNVATPLVNRIRCPDKHQPTAFPSGAKRCMQVGVPNLFFLHSALLVHIQKLQVDKLLIVGKDLQYYHIINLNE